MCARDIEEKLHVQKPTGARSLLFCCTGNGSSICVVKVKSSKGSLFGENKRKLPPAKKKKRKIYKKLIEWSGKNFVPMMVHNNISRMWQIESSQKAGRRIKRNYKFQWMM